MSQRLSYALRMDYGAGDHPRLSDWLSVVATCYIVCHETATGENPHVHAKFESDKKLSALRISFKRKFEDKVGNGAYSLKECDDDLDAYMRYICKGDGKENPPAIIMAQGLEYTPEAIAGAHDAYWVNNAALVKNKRKRTDLKENGTVVEKVEKICKEKGVIASDRSGIAKIYIRMYRDARKPINTFAARAVVNTVQLLLDDSDRFVDDLAAIIASV